MPVAPHRRTGPRAGVAATIAAVGLAALALAGCGGGAQGAAPSTTSTAATVATDGAPTTVVAAPPPGTPVTCDEREHNLEAAPDHVPLGTDVEYAHVPPAAGPHSVELPETGMLDEPVPHLMQVAALEVGFAIVQHDGVLRPDEVEALAALRAERVELVVMPSPGPMDRGARIAATTWERRLLCDGVDVDVLRSFLEERSEFLDG